MIRILVAAALLLIAVPAVQAASFDCAKAGTSFEKAICASPGISKSDEILAQAYATALGGLSKPSADAVKASQHDWLDYAARACSDNAKPIAGTYNDDQLQCLQSTFDTRIKALEVSRMQGGYRFYPYERYLLEVDPDATADDYQKLAEKHFETVKIDRNDDLAAAFNAMTETMRLANNSQMGEGETNLFVKDSDELAPGDTSSDIDITTSVKDVNSARITLETDTYWFGHGAAHGNYGVTYDHFLVGEKRALVAGDVFKGKGWQKRLSALVIDAIKEKLADGYFPDSEADMPKLVADPSRWDFSDDGLIMQFEPYEVTAYAGGAPTVTIPWDQLTDDLADNAQSITLGY